MRIVVGLGLGLVGCGGGDAPTWHADVAPIVEGRCASCHDAGGIGPFPLTSHAEVAEICPGWTGP